MGGGVFFPRRVEYHFRSGDIYTYIKDLRDGIDLRNIESGTKDIQVPV